MQISNLVEWGVIGLLRPRAWAVAVALERWRFYRQVQVQSYRSRVRLETELTSRLNVMVRWLPMRRTSVCWARCWASCSPSMLSVERRHGCETIMVGLALALKATAVGIGVAIPCVGLNNALRRVVRVKLAEFDEAQGG
jgi:biopolymer transport protein ExbB